MLATDLHLFHETGGRLFNDTLRRSTKNFSVGERWIRNATSVSRNHSAKFGSISRHVRRGELTTSQANLFRDTLLMLCTRTLPLCTIKEKRQANKKRNDGSVPRLGIQPTSIRVCEFKWLDLTKRLVTGSSTEFVRNFKRYFSVKQSPEGR